MRLKSEQIDKLAEALAKAQGVMRAAQKASTNPAFKGAKYADLASVIDALREPLSSNGLAYTQLVSQADGAVTVETVLMHVSGQWVSSELALRPVKADAQGIGSAITYGRRYALAAIVGLAADDDDDGNAASGHGRGAKLVPVTREPEPSAEPQGLGPVWQAKIDAASSIDALTAVGREWRASGVVKGSEEDMEFMAAWASKREVLG